MHSFCSSLTKFSSTKSVQTRFVAPQNLSIDTYLVIRVIISYDNFIAIDQMKKFGARLVFLMFNDNSFADNKRNASVEPGLRRKSTEDMTDI